MWCVSSTATIEESPLWFVWVRQQRNEGGRTERWGEVGGEGMLTGEWGGGRVSEFGQCSLNFKKGIEKGEGEGEWRRDRWQKERKGACEGVMGQGGG